MFFAIVRTVTDQTISQLLEKIITSLIHEENNLHVQSCMKNNYILEPPTTTVKFGFKCNKSQLSNDIICNSTPVTFSLNVTP